MQIHKEQFQEWADNPVTKYMMEQVGLSATGAMERKKLDPANVYSTALNTAHSEGFVEGVQEFTYIYNRELQHFTDEEDDDIL